MQVYVALVEVEPTADCTYLHDQAIGAMVRCYQTASSEAVALERISSGLMEEGLVVVDVEWLVDNSEVDWEHPESLEHLEALTSARASDSLVIARVDSWNNDDEAS